MIEGAAITFRHTGYCIIVMILISRLILVSSGWRGEPESVGDDGAGGAQHRALLKLVWVGLEPFGAVGSSGR